MDSQLVVSGDSCFRSWETFHHCFPKLGEWTDSLNSVGCKLLGGKNFIYFFTHLIVANPFDQNHILSTTVETLFYKTLENTFCHKRKFMSFENAGSLAWAVLQNGIARAQVCVRGWESLDPSEIRVPANLLSEGESHEQVVARVITFGKAIVPVPLNLILSGIQFTYFEPDLWSRHDYSYSHGTHIHKAAQANTCSLIQYFHDRGEYINIRDQGGATPLHHAARRGSIDAIKLLLKLNADFLAKTDKGETFIDLALNLNDPSFTEKLLASLTPSQRGELTRATIRDMKEGTTRALLKYYLTLPNTNPLENLKLEVGRSLTPWVMKILDQLIDNGHSTDSRNSTVALTYSNSYKNMKGAE